MAPPSIDTMNGTSFLRALALPAMIDTGRNGIDPRAVDDPLFIGIGDVELQAAALDNGVRLRWIQGKPYGDYLSYLIRWRPRNSGIIDPIDTGSHRLCWDDGLAEPGFFGSVDMTFTLDITSLRMQLYTFELSVLHEGRGESIAIAMIDAAPARHFHTDTAMKGEKLRLYEERSNNGSGLVIDPARGGPRRVTPSTALPRSVQLVLLLDEERESRSLRIATASASPEFGSSIACDPHVLMETGISEPHDLTFSDWYLAHHAFASCDAEYSTTGMITIPRRIDIAPETRGGEGFIVCMGKEESRRFARVQVLAGSDGRLLRGIAPDRYVELEVSLGHPGVPWA